jgi:hypothetical protein
MRNKNLPKVTFAKVLLIESNLGLRQLHLRRPLVQARQDLVMLLSGPQQRPSIPQS